MMFRGRTVLAFVLIAVIASVVMTTALVAPSDTLTSWMGRGAADTEDTPPANHTAAGISAAEIHKLNTTYQIIHDQYIGEVDSKKLIDGAIQGMLSTLEDPYTVYLDAEEYDQFDREVDAYFTGIGAEVSLEDGYVIVVAPIKGSPAEKAGIRARDLILSVNGESLSGLSLTEAVNKIRGPKGTQAKLQIRREGLENPIDLILVRDEIDLETVFSEMLDDGVGKIEIRQFSSHTVTSFREQLAELEEQGLQGLLIDVRNNPGGYLEGVAHILYSLIPKDEILLQTEARGGKREELRSQGPGRTYPMAVLINEGSASASEILAAAVQQSAGGKVFGVNSYGKGTIQSQFTSAYGDGSLLKLSVAKWLTPNGTWINEVGVTPDRIVEQPDYYYVAPISRERSWKMNDMGESVKNMQIMLNALGFETGRDDGYFSEGTAEALKKFQQKVNLEVTGELDTATIEQLELDVIEMLLNPENDRQLQEAIQWLSAEIAKGA